MDTFVRLRLCLITSAILVLPAAALGDHQQARGPTLYVSMLQRMGIEADKFGSGNATLTGLEMRG